MSELICGVFPSRGQTEEALNDLVRSGYNRDDLGVAMRVYSNGATRAARAARSLAAWVPNERILNLAGLGDVLVGGTIERCLEAFVERTTLAIALACLGVTREHAEWYEEQVRGGATLVTLFADEGGIVVETMRRHGALQVPTVEGNPGEAGLSLDQDSSGASSGQSSSADVRTQTAEQTSGAFPGWEPGGPGYSGLVPQQHEDGANIPTESED